MGKCVVSVSFCLEISSICKRMPQSVPEFVKQFEVLSILMQIPFNFREILFIVPTQSTQQRPDELYFTFFDENVAAFCFKNTSE